MKKRVYDPSVYLEIVTTKETHTLHLLDFRTDYLTPVQAQRDVTPFNSFLDLCGWIDEYEDEHICSRLSHWEQGIFKKKHFFKYERFENIYVEKEEFISAKLVWEFDPAHYSIKELAKRLTAEDFVEWCKDNCFSEGSLLKALL